jgi:hypothetical protein
MTIGTQSTTPLTLELQQQDSDGSSHYLGLSPNQYIFNECKVKRSKFTLVEKNQFTPFYIAFIKKMI